MFEIKKNEKNKSAVILSPEASVKISGASVESVVNAQAKTKRYSAKRDLYGDFAYAQPLKMTALALLFSFNLSTSWAGCKNNQTCGTSGHESECCWELIPEVDNYGNPIYLSDGTTQAQRLSISGNGQMKNYNGSAWPPVNAPWYDYRRSITSLQMDKNITNVGNFAFGGMPNLTSVDLPGVTSIGAWSFTGDSSLTYVGIDSTKIITPFGHMAFASTQVEDCSITDISTCGSCGNDYVKSGLGCVKDCGAGMLGKNGKCVSASEGCGENYKNMGGWCNRIRYTPAEAAQVLHNDNTNEVTITFRK